jgi:hypothetical protein
VVKRKYLIIYFIPTKFVAECYSTE